MSKITYIIGNEKKEIEIPQEDWPIPISKLAVWNGIQISKDGTCAGKWHCGKCKMKVIKWNDNKYTDIEMKFKLWEWERLWCQVMAKDWMEIEVIEN